MSAKWNYGESAVKLAGHLSLAKNKVRGKK